MFPAGEIDLEALGLKPSGDGVPATKRLRDSHHAAARLFAEGRRVPEVSVATGYSTARLRTLQQDQTFIELVGFYREQVQVAMADVYQRLGQLSLDAVQELQLRLDEEPDSFTVGQLMELVKTTADRSGNGPTSTAKHVHDFHISPADLQRIREISTGEVITLEQISEGSEDRPPLFAPSSDPEGAPDGSEAEGDTV